MFSRDHHDDTKKLKDEIAAAALAAKEKMTNVVEHSWEETRAMLEKAGCDVRQTMDDATKKLSDQVKKKPLASVGVSMLVGALVVLLIKR